MRPGPFDDHGYDCSDDEREPEPPGGRWSDQYPTLAEVLVFAAMMVALFLSVIAGTLAMVWWRL